MCFGNQLTKISLGFCWGLHGEWLLGSVYWLHTVPDIILLWYGFIDMIDSSFIHNISWSWGSILYYYCFLRSIIFLWDKILFGFLRFCLIVHYLRCPKFCWSSRFIPLLVFRIRFKGRKMLIVYPFCLFLQLIPRCCFPLQDFSNFNSKVYTISIPTCTSFPT